MPAAYKKAKIVKSEKIGGMTRLSVLWDAPVSPGQFFMLRADETYPLLSRPVSVHDYQEGLLSFLFETKGEGTKRLSEKRAGEIFLFGPLGNGFPEDSAAEKIALVAGGIGIAPLLYLARRLSGASEIDLYAGFRDESYLLGDFSPFVQNIFLATDSGKEGHKGFVTDLLDARRYDAVYVCGPEIMMEKIAQTLIDKNVPGYLSLEAHMACGVGACYGCARKIEGKMKCVCKDGPVFSAREAFSC